MNKVKLELKIPENKKIEHNGVEIEVIPFLTLSQQAFLINRYLTEYFTKSSVIENAEYDYIGAQYGLMNYVFQVATNIDIENLDSEIYADAALWEKITLSIINFYDFKDRLYAVVEGVKKQKESENSAGRIISSLVEQLRPTIEKLSEVNPEDILKVQSETKELVNKLEESSVLGKTLSDVGKT